MKRRAFEGREAVTDPVDVVFGRGAADDYKARLIASSTARSRESDPLRHITTVDNVGDPPVDAKLRAQDPDLRGRQPRPHTRFTSQ